MYRRLLHKALFFLLFIVATLFTWGILHITPFQNWVVRKVAGNLSKKLHTTVSVKHVDFSLFDNMLIEGMLVEDRNKDTLLYAGTAKVNITDWFFLKDKATLHYIGLNDAIINIQRKDSVWNYQFLTDYFSSPSKDTAKSGLQFDFQKIELQRVQFNNLDGWDGRDIHFSLQRGSIDAQTINSDKKKILIKSIDLESPVFSQSDYTGRKDGLLNLSFHHQDNKSYPYQWNQGGWEVTVNQVHLHNGTFTTEKETPERQPYRGQFDGQHLQFGQITGNLINIRLTKDTITGDISLSAKERSGLEVKKLAANMKFTPQIMEFNKLDLVTNKSRLGNYFAMHYKDFNADMANFLHSVVMEGNFENTQVNSDDIAFFASAMKSWKRIFTVEGTAKGSVDNLSAKKLRLSSGHTLVDGNISLLGLPDIMNTFIDFKVNDLQTNYGDLMTLFPSLRKITQPALYKLGNIRYRGFYTGFLHDFVAFGTVQTKLGTIRSDINMKLYDNKPSVYSGKISTGSFNLGAFLNNPQLGNIVVDGKINGSGFSLKDLKAKFDGQIHQFDFSGYTYKNIIINGNFEKKLFQGNASIDDPNVKIRNLQGTINLNERLPQFDMEADIQDADLQKLKITNENFVLGGHFNLNFKGDNIDNFLGAADITNATLLHHNLPLSFTKLNLSSVINDSGKALIFNTNELDGRIEGNFKVLELGDGFRLLLNRFYPSYFTRPIHPISDQHFSFELKTRNVNKFVHLFDKRLSGLDNSIFSGNFNSSANELNVIAIIPQIVYDGKTFDDIHLKSNGSNYNLLSNISVGEIILSDSLHFPGTILSLNTANDYTILQLKTKADKTLNEAELNAGITTYPDGVKIHFFPSSFIINDKKWTLEKDGELSIRNSHVDANEIKFSQGNQQIVISTELDSETSGTNVIAKLQTVNINDFAPFITKEPRMEGLLTGTLVMKDPFGKPRFQFDGYADNFILENKPIGKIDLNATANTSTGLINYGVHSDNKDSRFNIEGSYNFMDSTDNRLALNFQSERFDINTLEPYLGSIFSDMHGNVVSDLKVGYKTDHPVITGNARITDASLKVIYTQCAYSLKNQVIRFKPDEIDFGDSLVLSDKYNNTGLAGGKLFHQFFKNIVFDNIHFSTNKMLLLNTTKKDNSDFYGRVVGNADMRLDGPVTLMTIDISGAPTTNGSDSSHIYIASSSTKETGAVDYIDFIQFGTKMEDAFHNSGESNISVDLHLMANPACKIDVILDETTGDVIKGVGNGQLDIHVGSKDPLTIRGRYNITQGEYAFNFQTFIKKWFQITNGYIDWNRDPYEAAINIDAAYTAKNVDLSSLATSTGKGFTQKSDLTIIAHLTRTLKNPLIKFEFVLPSEGDYSKDPIVLENLKKLTVDENEMNKQVASLLLFNSFVLNDFRSSSVSFLSGTAGQVISGFLNNQFAKFFQKVFKDPTITPYLSLNSNYDITSPELIKALQASGNIGLKKEYFNGRLIVSLGGNVDYNNPYILAVRQTNILLTPDITVEYFLTADGKLRIVGFNRTSVDATLGQRNRTGVSLSYHKDFNTFREFFATSEEKKKRRTQRKEKKIR